MPRKLLTLAVFTAGRSFAQRAGANHRGFTVDRQHAQPAERIVTEDADDQGRLTRLRIEFVVVSECSLRLAPVNPGMQFVRATLYRHFATREQLILALAQESLAFTERELQPIMALDLDARAKLERG